MKCPKCGLLSIPGLTECKKCGYHFPSPPGAAGFVGDFPLQSQGHAAEFFGSPPSPVVLDPPPSLQLDAPDASALGAVSAHEPGQPWQDELAERVARFRHRRARLRRAFEPRSSLEFDFEGGDAGAEEAGRPDVRRRAVVELDLVLDRDTELRKGDQAPGSIPIERRLDTTALDADLSALKTRDPRAADSAPVEIVLEPRPDEEEPELVRQIHRRLAAPLSRRFAAGIVDLALLLTGAGLFVAVFLASGGRLNRTSLELGIVAFAAAVFLVLYFGLFTGLAFGTPGQSAFRLRVRTLEGEKPDAPATIWRAIGYLFSTVALMLGFVWALFDSEGLAWHDHMSRTCLAEVPGAQGITGSETAQEAGEGG